MIFNIIKNLFPFVFITAEAVIRNILHAKFKTSIKKSIVKLTFSVLAIYLAVFRPFRYEASIWVSSILFDGVILWSLVDTIFLIKNNYMFPIFLIQELNLRRGIVEFVRWKAKSLIKMYDPIQAKLSLPSADVLIQILLINLLKDIVLFVSFLSSYTLIVHWIIKPIIVEKYVGLTLMQIYLFPLFQAKIAG